MENSIKLKKKKKKKTSQKQYLLNRQLLDDYDDDDDDKNKIQFDKSIVVITTRYIFIYFLIIFHLNQKSIENSLLSSFQKVFFPFYLSFISFIHKMPLKFSIS